MSKRTNKNARRIEMKDDAAPVVPENTAPPAADIVIDDVIISAPLAVEMENTAPVDVDAHTDDVPEDAAPVIDTFDALTTRARRMTSGTGTGRRGRPAAHHPILVPGRSIAMSISLRNIAADLAANSFVVAGNGDRALVADALRFNDVTPLVSRKECEDAHRARKIVRTGQDTGFPVYGILSAVRRNVSPLTGEDITIVIVPSNAEERLRDTYHVPIAPMTAEMFRDRAAHYSTLKGQSNARRMPRFATREEIIALSTRA